MFIFLNRKGQSISEYAIAVGIIVAAAVAMQTYVKRGLQSRIKNATDYVETDSKTIFTGGQYEPYYLSSNFDNQRNSQDKQTLEQGGGVTREVTSETTSRTGNQQIGAAE